MSNAPNAEAGLLIYQATGDSYYLTWAQQMYNWVRTCLLAPNSMYYDHLDAAGTVNTALWECLVNQTAPMAELYALLAGSPPFG